MNFVLHQLKIENLETEVGDLTLGVEELKKMLTDRNNKVTFLSDQVFELSNTIKEVVKKMKGMINNERDVMKRNNLRRKMMTRARKLSHQKRCPPN